MKYVKNILYTIATICIALTSCTRESIHGDGFIYVAGPGKEDAPRVEQTEQRNVLLLYSAGYNSLSTFLKEDIDDLQQGWLTATGRNDNILLIYSHLTEKGAGYNTPTQPTLTRVYKDYDGQIIKDTLVRYPGDTRSATAEQLHSVLSFAKREFPAKSYGMIFSSHATGYLPAGYYSNPNGYVYNEKQNAARRAGTWTASQPVPYVEPEFDPSLPAVKSIGQDLVGTSGSHVSYEINLDDFAKALPMEMEYILFDACLMGGVEVAYELKDKCRYVGFSQTEVLAEGFDYRSLATHLLGSPDPDPQSVCEDYFIQYDILEGINRSATISMVDCSQMDDLAQVCNRLFEKYRSEIDRLTQTTIQHYYRSNYHWFFDLFDIVDKAGADSEEKAELQKALDKCVVYKAHTPKFMNNITISVYSGLSMYLPCRGSRELDKYYRTLEWNKATSLVK